MSGSISQPMMPQQGGMAPQGGMPPQLLAMLMAAAQQRQGGGPMQPQSGGPAQPMVGGPAQAQMPQAQMQPMATPAAQMPSQMQTPAPMPGGMSNSYAAAAAQRGRFGDSMLAHMTPGEIAVPPQVQTPQVMQALQAAFKQAGADVRQFAAGSPFAAHNPDTGQQEFSLWSAILPVLGGVVGSIIPGLGTAAGAALGGAAGGAAGGLIDHQGAAGTLLSALGGAAGGYAGGGGLSGLLGSGSGAASGAGAAGAVAPALNGAAGMTAGQAALINAAGNSAAAPITSAELSQLPAASPSLMGMLKAGGMAGVGAGMASSLAPPPTTNNNPPGFNKPLGPVNPNLQIGGRPALSAPTFGGYNPYTAVTSGTPYNFFPS